MNKVEVLIFFIIAVPTFLILVVGKWGRHKYLKKHGKWRPRLATDPNSTRIYLHRYGFPNVDVGIVQNKAGNYDQLLLELENQALERCALLNSTRGELG